MFKNISTHECMSGPQNLGVCEISDTYIPTKLLEIWRETWKMHSVGVCCHLQTCKSVVNMLIMGLALRQSLIVVSAIGILICKVYISPL